MTTDSPTAGTTTTGETLTIVRDSRTRKRRFLGAGEQPGTTDTVIGTTNDPAVIAYLTPRMAREKHNPKKGAV